MWTALLAVWASTAHALLFCPKNHSDFMYDNWLFRPNKTSPWILNYLVRRQINATVVGRWDSVNTALSHDGVHFNDVGQAVHKDCKDPKTDCAVWLGSGSIWRNLRFGENDDEGEFVQNFSQQYDCAQALIQRALEPANPFFSPRRTT